MRNRCFEDLCKAFGWQGGTIHQVFVEIKRLRGIDKDFDELGRQYREVLDKLRKDLADDEDEIRKLRGERQKLQNEVEKLRRTEISQLRCIEHLQRELNRGTR